MTRPYIRRTGTPHEKAAANASRWRRNNPVAYAAYMKRATARVKTLVEGAKAGPCLDCGLCYPSYVMDFDHVKGIKRFCIGHSAYQQGRKAVIAEMAKCEVVCANCHRERTHQRKVHLLQEDKTKETV